MFFKKIAFYCHPKRLADFFLASTTAAKKYISTKNSFLQDHTILFITQVMFKFVIYLFTFIAFATANYTTWSLVTDYTTYCPQSTEITVNNSIITITGPTTLTITGECTRLCCYSRGSTFVYSLKCHSHRV